MEKPRKKELLDRTQTIIHGIRAFASYGIGARIYGDGVDNIHLQKAITAAKDIESMSTWLEGEVKELIEELQRVDHHTVAEEIWRVQELLRKLTGGAK